MKDRENHFTEQELHFYRSGAVPKAVAAKIGRHLLDCDLCLARLPVPSAQEFSAALFGETREAAKVIPKNEKANVAASTIHAPFRVSLLPGLAWSVAGAAVIIFVVGAIFLSGDFKKEAISVVAGNIKETEQVDFSANQTINSPIEPPGKTASSVRETAKTTGESVPLAKRNFQKIRALKKENSPPKKIQSSPQVKKSIIKNADKTSDKNTFSAVRGNPKRCENVPLSEPELIADDDKTLVFRWKKIPHAAKYKFYISDDDEILIEEFETGGETSFVPTKPLDPAKTYTRKLIVTLENGNTIIGESRQFTIKDFRIKPHKTGKTPRADLRCLRKG